MNNDVSLAGAFLAGLVSFLSPCVLPLVPGYISMLSGVGMEQLRKGELPRAGLFPSALAFVAGFSVVFISFGASASAVGSFLTQNRSVLAPIAGALIVLFGLHLLGILIKLNLRTGLILGLVLVAAGIAAFRHGMLSCVGENLPAASGNGGGILRYALSHCGLGTILAVPFFAGLGASQFFSLSLIGFFGPTMARWLNRDVHLRNDVKKPGVGSGFLLGFAFAFGWTPCIGPILTAVLILASRSATITHAILLLAVYSAGLAIPFLLTALGIGQFMAFYKNFRKYLHAVEAFSGGLLLFIGALVFLNKLTWLTGKLGFLDSTVRWLEHALTAGNHGKMFWLIFGTIAAAIVAVILAKNWQAVVSLQAKKTLLIVGTVIVLIVGTILADRATRHATGGSTQTVIADEKFVETPEPELTLKDLDGKDVSLAGLKGKVVLVNFWATWCEPCRVEIPWLIEIQGKYGPKGFTVLGVAMDEEGKSVVAPFVARERFDVNGQKQAMTYPIVLGNEAAGDKFGGLLGFPTSVLISRDGKIVKRITGLISEEEISKAIEGQL